MDEKPIVAVIIPTHNEINQLQVSIESVLKQSYGIDNLRIIIVDNASNDGTYELILEYLKSYKEVMGIYRIAEETKNARVIKKAFELLSEQGYEYSTILLPGNELYEGYVEQCVQMMKKYREFNPKFLVCEVDNRENDIIIQQQNRMYEDENVFSCKEVIKEFLTRGILHKVQIFYYGFPFNVTTRLKVIFDVMPNTDWANIGYYMHEMKKTTYIYSNKVLGCVSKEKVEEKVYDLMKRYTTIKTLLFFVDRNVDKIDDYTEFKISVEEYNKAYKSLANLALYYAWEDYFYNKNNQAEKCLWFAEMVEEKITNEKAYRLIRDMIIMKKKCNFKCKISIDNELIISEK